MALDRDYFKALIVHLGFGVLKDAPEKFVKTYNNAYTITVDFNAEKIDYPPR